MNKAYLKYKLLLVMLGVITFTSCKKYLDVTSPSTTSPESAFGSTSNTNAVLIGVYNKLCGDNGYGNRLSGLFPQMADDFRTSGNYTNGSDRRGISMYAATPDNSDLYNPWLQLYSGISRANYAIKYIPLSALYTSGSDAEKTEMKRYYGEALALRAQFYAELLRNWGDVPAYFDAPTDVEDVYIPNTNRDETYNRIIADLKVAEDLVPWRSEFPSYGDFRFTKGAIKGLRARIALARGGYAFRTTENAMVRRADYLDFYKIAKDECLDIMNHRGDHTLNPVFENVFKTLHTTTRLDDAHELMFEVGAFGTNASTDSKIGYYDGLLFAAGSAYAAQAAGGGINAIPTYFYEFDQTKDCRRDVTIGSYQINATTLKIPVLPTSQTNAKFRKSWTAFNNASTSQNFSINWPILRFADVLLMYAEADNEINGAPSAAAISALTEVQRRAYPGNETLIPVTPTDKTGFFNAIVKERLLEFGGEGIRKYDLIRWNLLQTKLEETRDKLRLFMTNSGTFASVPKTVYYIAAPYNLSPSVTEVATINFYGGNANAVLFQPTTAPSTPTGYTSLAWSTNITEDVITSAAKGVAPAYVPAKSLFPFPATAIIQNPKIKQNSSY